MTDSVESIVDRETEVACARDHQPSATRRNLDSSTGEQQQFLSVATIERQFHNALVLDDRAYTHASSFNQRRVCLNFDCFRNLSNLQDRVDYGVCIDLQNNTGLHEGSEARKRSFKAVRTQRQIG